MEAARDKGGQSPSENPKNVFVLENVIKNVCQGDGIMYFFIAFAGIGFVWTLILRKRRENRK